MRKSNMLKDLRLQTGMSLRGLARKACISPAYLCELEKNDSIEGMGLGIAIKLSSALCISLEGMIGLTPLTVTESNNLNNLKTLSNENTNNRR